MCVAESKVCKGSRDRSGLTREREREYFHKDSPVNPIIDVPWWLVHEEENRRSLSPRLLLGRPIIFSPYVLQRDQDNR